jgi:RNA 2',3'-cyclic 3'-phosphodiesterase
VEASEEGFEVIRSFLAIELPDQILSKIGEVQKELKSSRADVRWVSPEKIHLTLKFFGNIEEVKIDSIINAIEGPVHKTPTFSLLVRGMGAFPHIKNPRVIWVGLVDPKGVLASFQKEVELRLSEIGFEPEDRAFQPHLTLGRVNSNRERNELVGTMEKHLGEAFGELMVERVILFKSELRPSGPMYTSLREVKLGG